MSIFFKEMNYQENEDVLAYPLGSFIGKVESFSSLQGDIFHAWNIACRYLSRLLQAGLICAETISMHVF